MKQNFQLALDKTLKDIERTGGRPTLLLHACCAPCSSYVLEYLVKYFKITLFFYNPNISPREEYETRLKELYGLVYKMGIEEDVHFIDSDYDPQRFYQIAKGLEELSEGGERCKKCYRLRLEQTARIAAQGGFDYFTTTLSISPYKNAEWLNEIGRECADLYGSAYLFSDFKKRGGYLRSIELSKQYSLYRQDFCGCVYSMIQKNKEKNEGS